MIKFLVPEDKHNTRLCIFPKENEQFRLFKLV